MANYIYGAVALTGGAAGSLDSIDGTDLAQGDAAIVFTANATYIYNLDSSSGGTEDSPNLIVPDANAGNKRWVLVSSRAAESSLNTTGFNKVLDANDDDVQKAFDTLDKLFNSDDFIIAPGSVSLLDSIAKTIATGNGTVTPSSHQFTIAGSGKIKTSGSGSTVTISADDLSIVTKVANYTITAVDDIVIGDCSGGNIIFTLPDATTKAVIRVFKKSSSNTLTINCYGSQTIQASTSITMTKEFESATFVSDKVNTWVIIGGTPRYA